LTQCSGNARERRKNGDLVTNLNGENKKKEFVSVTLQKNPYAKPKGAGRKERGER